MRFPRSSGAPLAALLAAVLLALGAAGPAVADGRLPDLGDGPVYRVTLDGMVDAAVAAYLNRALSDAEAAGASAVVLRIDTYGGLLDAADRIRGRLLDSPVPIVAVIDRNAASAGAMIAYAADRIAMTPGSSMGAATAVDQTGEYAPEKIQSYTRGLIRATAEATGRDPRIAEAMVDESISIPGVVEEGKLLTLSAAEADRLGVADALVDSADDALATFGLEGREEVVHSATRAEGFLRLLGSPVVAGILMLMMMGGLYFELQTPGVGVAGAAAVVGGALFFAPHYMLGLVESWEIALFVVGVGLLITELFVTPGFGLFGAAGIVAVLTALLIALVPNVGFDFPTDGAIAQASVTLAAAMTMLVLLAISLARVLPRSERFGRLILQPNLDASAGYTSADTDEALVGKRGTALTGLRPSGTAEIADRRIDVVTEGVFVDAGATVEVVFTRGARVVVREV